MPAKLTPGLIGVLLGAGLGCSDDSAGDGSGTATGDIGAEEGGDDDEEPGPDGPGCSEAWEGWWDQSYVGGSLAWPPEARGQQGRLHASGAVAPTDASPAPVADKDTWRATLIADDSVFSTSRHLAVSWCLGNIHPNPQGPGAFINPESDALNLERYLMLRREVERATRMWERHSRMNFVHLVGLDDR